MPPHETILNHPSIRWNCRLYQGDRPCRYNRLCSHCKHFKAFDRRICIIKIGALGDVIRTLCILPKLNREFPGAHITWVTKPSAARMIDGHAMIHRVLEFNPINNMVLQQEQFDLLISLDKEPQPCALANSLSARTKLGIGLSPSGKPVPFNAHAVDYFQLGLSDELKFNRNTKSYARLVYESLGWQYSGQPYELPVDDKVVDAVRGRLHDEGWRPDRKTLGVNVGAGTVFANKMWPAERTRRMLEVFAARQPDVQVMLLGGPGEKEIMDQLHIDLPWALHTGCENNEKQFTALVDQCDALFTGDTMALHVAVARKKYVVAIFGPTCQQEIDLFGRGYKLVAQVPCSPCYKRVCDHDNQCVQSVSMDDVLGAIDSVLSGDSSALKFPLPLRRSA